MNADNAVSQPAIFYYGPNQLQAPFGNGYRCVAAGPQGTFRLPVRISDGSGVIEDTIDFSSSPSDVIQAGETWQFQSWFRDPGGGGSSYNLSDGLSLEFRP